MILIETYRQLPKLKREAVIRDLQHAVDRAVNTDGGLYHAVITNQDAEELLGRLSDAFVAAGLEVTKR